MYSSGLITASVRDNPSYNHIEREFTSSLSLLQEKKEFEQECKKFLCALKAHDGPLEKLGNTIEKEWRDRASSELGISLNFY